MAVNITMILLDFIRTGPPSLAEFNAMDRGRTNMVLFIFVIVLI